MSIQQLRSATYYPVLLHKTLKKTNCIMKIDQTGIEFVNESVKVQIQDLSVSIDKDHFYLNKKVIFQVNTQLPFNIYQIQADILQAQRGFRRSLDDPIETHELLLKQQGQIQVKDDGILFNQLGQNLTARLNGTTNIICVNNQRLVFFACFNNLQSVFSFLNDEDINKFSQQLVTQKLHVEFADTSQYLACKDDYNEQADVEINNEKRILFFQQHTLILDNFKVSMDGIKAFHIQEQQQLVTVYFYDLQKWKIKTKNLQQLLVQFFNTSPRGFLSKLRFAEQVIQNFQQQPLNLIDDSNFLIHPISLPYQKHNKTAILSQNLEVLRLVLSNLSNYKQFIEQEINIMNLLNNVSNLEIMLFLMQLIEFKIQYENKSLISQFQTKCFAAKQCNSFDELNSDVKTENQDPKDKELCSKLRTQLLDYDYIQNLLNQTLKTEFELKFEFNLFIALMLCKVLIASNHDKSQQLARKYLTSHIQILNIRMVETISEYQLLAIELISTFLKICSKDQLLEFIYYLTSEATALRVFQFMIRKSPIQFIAIDLICQIAAKETEFVRVLRQVFPFKLTNFLVSQKINEFITTVNTTKGVYTTDTVWDEKIAYHIVQQLEQQYISYQDKKISYAFNFHLLNISVVGISSHPLNQYHIDVGNGVYLSGILQSGIDSVLSLYIGEDYIKFQDQVNDKISSFKNLINSTKINYRDLFSNLWSLVNSQQSQQIVCASYFALALLSICFRDGFIYYPQLLRKIANYIFYGEYVLALYSLSLLEIVSFQTNESDYTKRNFYSMLGTSEVISLICVKILPLPIYENFKNNCQQSIQSDFFIMFNDYYGKLINIGLRILIYTVKANPANDIRGKPYYPSPIIYQTILSKSIIPHFLALLLTSYNSQSADIQQNLQYSQSETPLEQSLVDNKEQTFVEDYYVEIVIYTLILLRHIGKQSKILTKTIIDYGFVEIMLCNPLGRDANIHIFEFIQEMQDTRVIVERLLPAPFVNIIYKYPPKELASIFTCEFHATLQVIWSSSMRKELQMSINQIAGMLINALNSVIQKDVESQHLQDYVKYINQQQSFLPMIYFESVEQHPVIQQYNLLSHCFSSGELYLNLFSSDSYNQLISIAQPSAYKSHDELLKQGFSLTHLQAINTIQTLLNLQSLDQEQYDNYQYNLINPFLFGSLSMLIQKLIYLSNVTTKQIVEINQQMGQVNPLLKDQLDVFRNKLKLHMIQMNGGLSLFLFSLKLISQRYLLFTQIDEEFASMIKLFQLIEGCDLFINEANFKMFVGCNTLVKTPLEKFVTLANFIDSCSNIKSLFIQQLPNYFALLINTNNLVANNFLDITLTSIKDQQQLNIDEIQNSIYYLLLNLKPLAIVFQLVQKLLDLKVTISESSIILLVNSFYQKRQDSFQLTQLLLNNESHNAIITQFINERYKTVDSDSLIDEQIYEIDYIQNENIFAMFNDAVQLYLQGGLKIQQIRFKCLNKQDFVIKSYYISVLLDKLHQKYQILLTAQEEIVLLLSSIIPSILRNVDTTCILILITLFFKYINKDNFIKIIDKHLLIQQLLTLFQMDLTVLENQCVLILLLSILQYFGQTDIGQQAVHCLLSLATQKLNFAPYINQSVNQTDQYIKNSKLKSLQIVYLNDKLEINFLSAHILYSLSCILADEQLIFYEKYLLSLFLKQQQNDLNFKYSVSILVRIVPISQFLKQVLPNKFIMLMESYQFDDLFKVVNTNNLKEPELFWTIEYKNNLINYTYPQNQQIIDFQQYLEQCSIQKFTIMNTAGAPAQLLELMQTNSQLALNTIKYLFKYQPEVIDSFFTEQWKIILYNNLNDENTMLLMRDIVVNKMVNKNVYNLQDLLYFLQQIYQLTEIMQECVTQISCHLLLIDDELRIQFQKSSINDCQGIYYLLATMISEQISITKNTRQLLALTLAQITNHSKDALIEMRQSLTQLQIDGGQLVLLLQKYGIECQYSDTSFNCAGDLISLLERKPKNTQPTEPTTTVPKEQKELLPSLLKQVDDFGNVCVEISYMILAKPHADWTSLVDSVMGW